MVQSNIKNLVILNFEMAGAKFVIHFAEHPRLEWLGGQGNYAQAIEASISDISNTIKKV